MEEENKVNASAEASTETSAPKGGLEPHGSAAAPRPGDRKDGSHRGRPSERRGGRGGFRNGNDDGMTERVVAINRVSKTVQGGKHIRFSALAVVGDGKGKYGFAMTKSSEVPDAIKKSLAAARKYMLSIHLVKSTIAHDVEGVYGSTKVVLKPAPAGTGIVAGGAVRAVVELAGIKNVVAKVYGSRTPINVIRATSAGLQSLQDYETVMILRGKKTPEEFAAKREAERAARKAAAESKGDK
ncbi:MAG: 30S ribosomal protein S5 [Candidatus Enteromonas sp.]|nr:30S ribosomal protein S5 [Candidatus Enteromonas sp.]MDY6093978.1 30S ribosomal protein S5 [Candidatus Enteromonas sp.]